MKNRKLTARLHPSESIGVEKQKQKKRIQKTAGRTKGAIFIVLMVFMCSDGLFLVE